MTNDAYPHTTPESSGPGRASKAPEKKITVAQPWLAVAASIATIVAAVLGVLYVHATTTIQNQTNNYNGLQGQNQTLATSLTAARATVASQSKQLANVTSSPTTEPSGTEGTPVGGLSTLRLGNGDCHTTSEFSLYDLGFDTGGPFGSASSYADVQYKTCGIEDNPTLSPANGAEMSNNDVSATAGYATCLKDVNSDAATSVPADRQGATFCVEQGQGSVSHFGGQRLARLTVSKIDSSGNLTVTVQRWEMGN